MTKFETQRAKSTPARQCNPLTLFAHCGFPSSVLVFFFSPLVAPAPVFFGITFLCPLFLEEQRIAIIGGADADR